MRKHGVTHLLHNGVILSFVCKNGHSCMQKEAHRQYKIGIPIKRVGGRNASKDFIVLLSQAKSNHQTLC